MRRMTAAFAAAAMFLLPCAGCHEVKEEVLEETGEVLREQKFKAVEATQDVVREQLDTVRESAADSLTGDKEEAAEGDTDEAY